MKQSLLLTFISKPYVWATSGVCLVSAIMWFILPIGFALSSSLALLGIYALYVSFQYDKNKSAQKTMLTQQFLMVFRYFQVLIEQDMNAYQAVKTLLNYVDDPLHHQLHVFLLQIDHDKSIIPYQTFSTNFQSIMIEQVLLSMYQLDRQGSKGMTLFHFNFLFDQVEHQAFTYEMRQYHDRLQGGLHTVMIGTGLLAFSFLIGVVDIIFGMLYGS
jgi:hypothetical protein